MLRTLRLQLSPEQNAWQADTGLTLILLNLHIACSQLEQ
jgi:hypothetical protein